MNLHPLPVLELAAAAAVRAYHLHPCGSFCQYPGSRIPRCRLGLRLWREVRRALERWEATARLRELARRPRVFTRGIPLIATRDGGQLGAEWTRGTWSSRDGDAPADCVRARFDRARPYCSHRR